MSHIIFGCISLSFAATCVLAAFLYSYMYVKSKRNMLTGLVAMMATLNAIAYSVIGAGTFFGMHVPHEASINLVDNYIGLFVSFTTSLVLIGLVFFRYCHYEKEHAEDTPSKLHKLLWQCITHVYKPGAFIRALVEERKLREELKELRIKREKKIEDEKAKLGTKFC